MTLSRDTSASGRTGSASSPGASVEGDAIADGARIARRRECVGAIILAGHEEANRPFLGTPEKGWQTRPLTERKDCRGRPLTVGTPETRGELRPTPRRVQAERHAGDEREEFRQRRDRRERRLAPSPPGYARVLRQPARRARRGGSRPGECAASAHGTVFVGESDGPIRAYNANDGVSRLFIDRDRDKSVNCLAVVNGSDLWVGGAAGDLSVYSLRSPVDGNW